MDDKRLIDREEVRDKLRARRVEAHAQYNFAMEQAYTDAMLIVSNAKTVDMPKPVVMDKPQEWLPADMPPKNDVNVIVYKVLKNGRKTIDLGYWGGKGAGWVTRGSAQVGGWMPLPEVPE